MLSSTFWISDIIFFNTKPTRLEIVVCSSEWPLINFCWQVLMTYNVHFSLVWNLIREWSLFKTFNNPNDGINVNDQKYFYTLSHIIMAILAELRHYFCIMFTVFMYLLRSLRGVIYWYWLYWLKFDWIYVVHFLRHELPFGILKFENSISHNTLFWKYMAQR